MHIQTRTDSTPLCWPAHTLLWLTHPDACEVVHPKGEMHFAGSHCRGAPSASATSDVIRGIRVWRHVLNQAQQPATEQQAFFRMRHMVLRGFHQRGTSQAVRGGVMPCDHAKWNHPRLRSGVAAFAVPSAPACWSAVSTGAVWRPGAESPLPVALLLTSSISKLQSRQQAHLGRPCAFLC